MTQPAEPAGQQTVAMTLQLGLEAHRRLKAHADQFAGRLSRPRVGAAEVLRALLAELDGDAHLQARVAARLQAGEGGLYPRREET